MHQVERSLYSEDEIEAEWNRTKDTHGSARAALPEEQEPYMYRLFQQRHQQKAPGTPRQSWLAVGKAEDTGSELGLTEKEQEEHVLAIARSGAGKGVYYILPGLFREEGSRSLFIIDSKDNELEILTSGWLAQHHRVVTFAPMEPERSIQFNPLGYIKTQADAEDLAHSWVKNTGEDSGGSGSFFNNSERMVITAAILHLVDCYEPLPPFVALAELVNQDADWLSATLTNSPSRRARKQTGALFRYLVKHEETFASVMIGVVNRFARLYDDNLQVVTKAHECLFEDMVDEPTALFLSIPDDHAERLQPLSSIFIRQLFTALIRKAKSNKEHPGKLKRGYAVYLDELCNAGYVPRFTTMLTTSRSRRIALLIAVQSLFQLDQVYGVENLNIILEGCKTHLVFPGIGLDLAEQYCRQMGTRTVQSQGQSRSNQERQGLAALLGDGRSREGESSHEAARPYMYPDEIKYMQKGKLLLLPQDVRVMPVKATPWYLDPEIKDRKLPMPEAVPKDTTLPDVESLFTDAPKPADTAALEQENAELRARLARLEAQRTHGQDGHAPQEEEEEPEQRKPHKFYLPKGYA